LNEHGRLVDIIVLCVAGFLLPMMLFDACFERVQGIALQGNVVAFAESVATKGSIDYRVYENFMEKMNAAEEVFTEIYVEHDVLAPEYVIRSVDDTEDYLDGLFDGSNNLKQEGLDNTRPEVYDPGMPPEESLIGNAMGSDTSTVGPDASHVHGVSCYHGTQHWHDDSCTGHETLCNAGCTKHAHTSGCYSYSQVGCGGTTTYVFDSMDTIKCDECYGPRYLFHYYLTCSSCTRNWGHSGWAECPGCNFTNAQWANLDYTGICDGYDSVLSCTNADKYCDPTGELCTVCGGDGKTTMLACTKTDGGYYLANGSNCPALCDEVVTVMVPIMKEQVLDAGECVDARVKAVFLDGHTEIVNATVSGFDDTAYNVVQTVTLSYGTYKGMASNLGVSTVSTKVMVRYPVGICVNGHRYYQVNGNNTLCPYCKAYPKSITVYGAHTIPFCISRGTELYDNGIYLQVMYYDGHEEMVSMGWLDNLDKTYIGEQTVTIAYKGVVTTLLVKNERVKTLCSVCGYGYSLYPDNKDPGCPKCLSAIPVFTGNVLRYTEIVSCDEILDELYQGDGIYYFSRGDRLEMKVWKMAKTQKNAMLKRLSGKDMGVELVCMYSIKIRDEVVMK